MPRLHQQHERVLSKIIGRLRKQPASECQKSPKPSKRKLAIWGFLFFADLF